VPLAQWTSDAGGRGIPLFAAIQSPSQLRQRWTDAEAETIWNNANITLVFGGLKNDKDLQALSQLCGERDERIYTHSGGWWSGEPRSSSYTLRRVPVMAASQIRQLGKQELLVLHRNTRPFLAKIRPVWRRQDVKGAERRPVPVPVPAAVVEDVPVPNNVRRLRLVEPEEGTA
jgi:type IV secretory pathway TraG/TraD family ATPase VirD4